MFTEILNGFLDLVYPPHCILCKKPFSAGSPAGFVCLACQSHTQWNRPPFCPRCSRYLGTHPRAATCSACQRNPPRFDFAWSACIFNEHLKALIHLYKYRQKTFLRTHLAQLMIVFIEKYALDIRQFDNILAMPLSSTRLRERGFNQALLLARIISRHYGIPLSSGNLVRVHDAPSQTLLRKKERWTNIAGAFRIKNSKGIHKKNILILDDLLTTGATSSEAAKTLKDVGAKRVGVLTLATAL